MPQLSLPDWNTSAVVMEAIPAPFTFTEAFLQTRLGGSMSFTVTENAQEAVWPLAAVAVKVLIVMPSGKMALEESPVVWVVDTPGQLSVPSGTV